MKIFTSSKKASEELKSKVALTLGNFDGIHRGHRWIMKELINEADKRGLKPVAYTFDPHPAKLLAPEAAPKYINTLAQKKALFKKTDLSALVIEKFNHRFAQKTPKAFFENFILKRMHAEFVMVGYDFTFGAKRAGNVDLLETLCAKHGIDCRIIKPQLMGDTLVSSTVVRQYIRHGRIKEVIDLLERPFFIEGKIIKGDQRGRELGFPTINVQMDNELTPKKGVYLCRVDIGDKSYIGLSNVGRRPTFEDPSPITLESHLLDFKGRAYGRRTRIYFYDRLRDEMRFRSVESLVKQIGRDIKKGRSLYQKMSQQKKWADYLKWKID